jgi:hypothetical protein
VGILEFKGEYFTRRASQIEQPGNEIARTTRGFQHSGPTFPDRCQDLEDFIHKAARGLKIAEISI